MLKRSVLSRSLVLAACAASVAVPCIASAQQASGAVVRSSMVIKNEFPITDDAAHALVLQNFANVLVPGAEENQIVLVVDANGNYVGGKATKAIVIRRTAADGTPTVVSMGDSTWNGASVIVRRVDGAEQNAATAMASAVFVASNSSASGTASPGVMGTGYSFADIGGMGTRQIAAGEWRDDALTVTVIKLK